MSISKLLANQVILGDLISAIGGGGGLGTLAGKVIQRFPYCRKCYSESYWETYFYKWNHYHAGCHLYCLRC